MIFLIAWLIGIIPAWLFIWPRLLGSVISYRKPDAVDYAFSGYISLMFGAIWPVTLFGFYAAHGLSRLGRFLFEKHAS